MKLNQRNVGRVNRKFIAHGLVAGVYGVFAFSASAGTEIRTQESAENEIAGLTGDWGGARAALNERGISPFAVYEGEIFGNHRDGLGAGTGWGGLLDFGVELDLEKLVGWQGATFFANAFYFHGDDVSGNFVGDFDSISNNYTETSFNFFNIFLQQSFANEDSFLKIGQIALDDDFMFSETADLFINPRFGPMPLQSGNTAAPVYALAAPGAVIHYRSAANWFVQGGLYAGDAGPEQSNNQGFDWRTGGSAGWMWMAETGFHYGDEGGSVVKIGGYYHSGDFERFSDGRDESGIYSFYGLVDHEIIRADSGPGLKVFVRGGVTPQGRIAAVSGYADTGIVASNLLKDDDALGLGMSWTKFSDPFVAASGGHSSEIAVELTYQLPVTEWLAIQPDLQYIVNPQSGRRNALVTGVRAEITF